MDKLKQYIEQHRAEMDVDIPPNRLLENIQAQTKPAIKYQTVYRLTKYAVAALVIFLIGTGIWLTTRDKKKVAPVATNQNTTPAQQGTGNREDSAVDTSATRFLTGNELTEPLEMAEKKPLRNKASLLRGEDLKSIDKTYSHLINYQMERLRKTPVYAESPDYFTRFVSQLAQMEEDEEEIKKDMEQYGMNDRMLEGLISIYQQKLGLLKTLKKEISKMNGMVNKKSTTASQAYYLNL